MKSRSPVSVRSYLLNQEHTIKCVTGVLVNSNRACTCGLSDALKEAGITMDEIVAAGLPSWRSFGEHMEALGADLKEMMPTRRKKR